MKSLLRSLSVFLMLCLLISSIPVFSVNADTQKATVVVVDRLPEGNERIVTSLDGIWDLTADAVGFPNGAYPTLTIPAVFDNTIPVPGLSDMAEHEILYPAARCLWYKKVVELPGVPARATLKINKAQYGKYIFVNGQYVTDHQFNFVAAEIDVTKYLKTGKNEIVIMLGPYNSQNNLPGGGYKTDFDVEKKEHLAGFTDSVSLILTSGPNIDTLQTAPDIINGTLFAEASISNNTGSSVRTDVTFSVLDKEGNVVGTSTSNSVIVPANRSAIARAAAIKIEGFDESKLWTPDNPYLYTIKVSTSGDTYSTRVGMRTFNFDLETKLAMLNGKPYYLRGTNICINRFYEDPARTNQPWDKEWVTQLIKEFKGVNWDCARMSVGFAPEFWYDLFDELGFLIMDEYPSWAIPEPGDIYTNITEECREWIYERGNHPSVVVWDVQNESWNAKTSQVINALRDLDPQNRPWDNGWEPPQSETDPYESHPYLFPNFRIERLNSTSAEPFKPPALQNMPIYPDNPQIINEYAFTWIDRAGNPCAQTKELYKNYVPSGTLEDNQRFYADTLATLTEFWRISRRYTGILQFCGLSYSFEDQSRVTSDVLMPDISTPVIRPYLAERLRDCFNPVGICLEDYTERIDTGKQKTVRVSMINDTYEPVEYDVTLAFEKDGRVYSQLAEHFYVDALSKTSYEFTYTAPSSPGQYTLTASYFNGVETVSSVRNIKVEGEEIDSPYLNLPVDIETTHWAENQMYEMIERGIILGVAQNDGTFLFLPENKLSRAEFAAMITRLLEIPVSKTYIFDDVTSDAWYNGYVGAVSDKGIMQGVTDTLFDPSRQITRQEMAIILLRISRSRGVEFTADTSILNRYLDAADFADWSKEGISFVVENELLQGYPDQTFKPAHPITRAEISAVLSRFIAYLK